MNRQERDRIIEYEKQLYNINEKRRIWGAISHYSKIRIWKWLYYSRMNEYYSQFYNKGFLPKLISFYYLRRRNILAEKLGFDIETKNVGKGLMLYHLGATVINGSAIIGENCILHGNNCIGNKGPKDSPCPVIGNNVEIGVGAKIIGGVTIADNIKIGAGAIVVHSFLEEGITIGGIPARRIK